MKSVYILVILFISLYTAAVIFLLLQTEPTKPAPTTYQTGLYVQSDQLQQTIDGKELQ